MRFAWLLVVAALLAAPALAADPPPAGVARKPNIVILLSDDAGYNEFSAHGNPKYPTPRIDSIGADGVRFTNGYVSGTVCSPTRAGLLAGRYQQRFGHEFNIPPAYSETNGLPLDETLLPMPLESAGYRTLALGKWHLGYAPKFHPMERGFTDYYGFLQGSRSYWPLEKPGRLNQMLADRAPVVKEDFGYMTDHLAEKAAEYIAKHKAQPFFIYLAFNATHTPLHATEADLAKAGGDKKIAMTLALDRAVGKVLDSIDQNGLRNDTLVVFLNDNGGAIGHDNAPLRGRKGQTWEGGIRVPFMLRWPGVVPARQVIDTPVISLDLYATSLAAAGIDKAPGKPLDGLNLLPVVRAKAEPLTARPLFWKNGESWAVRDGNLKLVGGNSEQKDSGPALFDLAADIGESKDLSAARPEEVKRLKKLYDDWAATHKPTPWGKGRREIDDDK